MPIYNSGLYLREALDSILQQTFTDFEVLLYNDGSTDNTREILDSYGDSRLRIVNSAENKGLIYWLNEGVANARGKYIARMDGDDICMLDRFEKQFRFMESNPEIGFCGTQLEVIGTGQKILRPTADNELRWWIFRGTPVAHPSVIMRTSVLRDNGLWYDPQAYLAEDYDLWWRMARFCKIGNIDEVLLQYRIHKDQESSSKSKLQFESYMQSMGRFVELMQIDIFGFKSELLYSFFNGKQESNSKNLEWIYKFFKELEHSSTAATFFGLAEITLKMQTMVSQTMSYLESYEGRLVKLIRNKEFRKLLKVSGTNVYAWIIKSLIGWKTRVN